MTQFFRTSYSVLCDVCECVALFKRYNLITIFFNIFFWPECKIFGFANISYFFFNRPACKFLSIWIPFLQNQNIAFIALPIGETKFVSFFTIQNFLKVFWPNFFFVFHINMVISTRHIRKFRTTRSYANLFRNKNEFLHVLRTICTCRTCQDCFTVRLHFVL